MRSLPFPPLQPKPRASEWRWIEYSEPVPADTLKPASRPYAAISKLTAIDQGTGAKLAALAERKLIEIQWHHLNARKPPSRSGHAQVPRRYAIFTGGIDVNERSLSGPAGQWPNPRHVPG